MHAYSSEDAALSAVMAQTVDAAWIFADTVSAGPACTRTRAAHGAAVGACGRRAMSRARPAQQPTPDPRRVAQAGDRNGCPAGSTDPYNCDLWRAGARPRPRVSFGWAARCSGLCVGGSSPPPARAVAGLGERFAYIHTGVTDIAYNGAAPAPPRSREQPPRRGAGRSRRATEGARRVEDGGGKLIAVPAAGTTLAVAKKGAGIAPLINMCLERFQLTKVAPPRRAPALRAPARRAPRRLRRARAAQTYWEVCTKYNMLDECYPNAFFDGALAPPSSCVRLVRGVGRGVSDQYGGWDEACPISTGGGTRRVRSVRGVGRGVSDQYGGWDEACPISTGREGGGLCSSLVLLLSLPPARCRPVPRSALAPRHAGGA